MKDLIKRTILGTLFTFAELGRSVADLCIFSGHCLGLTKSNPFESEEDKKQREKAKKWKLIFGIQ